MSLSDNQFFGWKQINKAILEYIFEDEKIFYAEMCDSKAEINDSTELCQEAKEYYNFIFTCCVISSVSSTDNRNLTLLVNRNNCLWSFGRQIRPVLDSIAKQFDDHCWVRLQSS